MTLISYLGPKGTFSHDAAKLVGEDLVSCCGIPAVFENVFNGETELGVVPIENSIEGSVGITLDSLARFDLKICREIIIPINQNLIVNPGCTMDDISEVYSHAQALAQCQGFISKHNLKSNFSGSTANACKNIIGDKSKAAIGNANAVNVYGLEILRENIQDTNNNETKFIVISKKANKFTGNDKTSIVFSIYEDKPGELYRILGFFQNNNINLTKIESRPSKKGLGKYLFFVDFEGHADEDLIKNIISKIEENTYFLKVLGSYPQF